MTIKLFDRERETTQIVGMLGSATPCSMAVLGASGVGKSALLQKCLDIKACEIELPVPFVKFSFKPERGSGIPSFASFLKDLNDKHHPFSLKNFFGVKLKSFTPKIPGSPVDFSFDILPDTIDENYIEILFGRLVQARVRFFVIENIEFCCNPIDVSILSILGELENAGLKIIFEVGTLANIDRRLRKITENQKNREIVQIETLDREKTIGLHRFMHKSEPPPDVYKRTGGLPLAVEYEASIGAEDSILDWVEEKLNQMESNCWDLAYILSNLNEPCPISYLELIYGRPDFHTAFMKLLRGNILQADAHETRFKHPSTRLVLREKPFPYFDKKILSSVLLHEKTLSDDSTEFFLFMAGTASKLGSKDEMRFYALKGLAAAYERQDALGILSFCKLLLEKGVLAEQQLRIVCMVEIQALNQLMRTKDAASRLDEHQALLSKDQRVDVLRAMTWCQENKKPESNELIQSLLLANNQNPRSIVVALAILIANDISLDNEDRAKTSFEDAIRMTQKEGMQDLEEELVRLNAKIVSPPEVAIDRMKDYLDSAKHPSSEVGRARLLHNLGVQEMLLSDGQDGFQRLQDAREVFQYYGLSFAAYSAVSLAVAEVARERIEEAIETLVDAQCHCREQYDLFGVYNNLAGCFLLKNKPQKALDALKRAEEVLVSSAVPLEDRILQSCLYQNKALAYLRLRDFETARKEIEKVPPLVFARHLEERNARREEIKNAIQQENAAIRFEKSDYKKTSWLYTRFLPNFLTLSFYDYPFLVVSKEEVAALQSILH